MHVVHYAAVLLPKILFSFFFFFLGGGCNLWTLYIIWSSVRPSLQSDNHCHHHQQLAICSCPKPSWRCHCEARCVLHLSTSFLLVHIFFILIYLFPWVLIHHLSTPRNLNNEGILEDTIEDFSFAPNILIYIANVTGLDCQECQRKRYLHIMPGRNCNFISKDIFISIIPYL